MNLPTLRRKSDLVKLDSGKIVISNQNCHTIFCEKFHLAQVRVQLTAQMSIQIQI